MIETSVVIPTYRRPDGVRRAVASVVAQQGASGFEIVVVDNDVDGSAASVVAALGASATVPIRYVHEKRPGISYARNTGVARATGRYLAFLDDDEEAGPGWLANLLTTLAQFGADAAVGPVLPRFPAEAAGAIDAYRRQVYTRDAGVPSGTSLLRWNIGNSLFVKARCFVGDQPFAPELGRTGGEDTVFLRQMTRRGCRMVWCAEAVVWETVPAERLAADYLLRRAFRGAQTTTFVCAAVRPREWRRAARLMATGAAQLAVYGPAALVLRALRRERGLPVTAKAVAGLGKLLWHPRLHLRMYR